MLLFIRHALAMSLGLMALSLHASAQTSTTAPVDTPDRFAPRLEGIAGQACLDLISAPKQPWQAACYATGTSNRFGTIDASSVQCQDASISEKAKSCFAGFEIKPTYFGYRGPVCAAILFDVHASGMAPPNQFSRRVMAKEVYPCEGHLAPARSADDPKPGSGPPPKFVEKFDVKWESCVPASQHRATPAICLARAAVDASGKLTGQKTACSEPAFETEAAACAQAIRVKAEYRSSTPSELCLRISFNGEEKKTQAMTLRYPPLNQEPGLDRAFPKAVISYPVGISMLKACPDSGFTE